MEKTKDQGGNAPAQPAAAEIPAFLINGKRVIRFATTLFLIAILFVFPIYYRDYYFDIPKVKYQFYYSSVLALFAGVAVTALVMMIVDLTRYEGRHTAAFFERFSPKKIGRTLTVPDVALIFFLAVAALSTALSDYVFESFWGNEGRFSGLFLLLLYGVSFWMISRLSDFRYWYLELFLVSSVLVCAF